MERLKHLEGQVFGNYQLEKKIGEGTYGIVYKAVKTGSHTQERMSASKGSEVYAIKIINMKDAKDRHKQLVGREIEILQKVEDKKHPNIISFFGTFYHDTDPCIVMEYCKGGTLYEKIRGLKEKGKVMEEEDFRHTIRQIVSGVELLHDMNIIHRDLKTKNILLSQDGKWKICDFGVAKLVEIFGNMTTRVGTPYYMCPEVINGKDYDQKADIWSLGCSSYEMATGNYAFDGKTVQDIKNAVSDGKLPDTERIKYSSELETLIIRMLSYEPASRPTIKSVIEYLDGYKGGTEEKRTKKKKKKESKHNKTEDEREKLKEKVDSGVESGSSIGGALDSRVISKNKEFLETESAKLQHTLVSEIKSHQATDIVSLIKSLQKKDTPLPEFKKKVSEHIGKELFDRLFPVMQALKCIEDGRRELQKKLSRAEETLGLTYSHLTN